jgi:acyl-[acyl-carrier-protein]-phospholipid O-acyltransferase/long-chain-fatty-acid--[acyl-carrier-protein] ligase
MLRLKGFLPYICIIFFNAFVDLGHKILIQNTLYQTSSANHFSLMSSIINAFILLPYLLLFTPSGFIADKFKKVRILRITAAAAIPLTMLATWSYFQGYFYVAFFTTLLLATQSAFNSPAKYGYIKELFGKANIAPANAVVQTTAIMAILAGTFIFSLIFDHYLHSHNLLHSTNKHAIMQAFAPAGFVLIFFSCCEAALTFMIPQKPAADPHSEYTLNHYVRGHYLKQYLKQATRSPLVFLCIIGLGLFWGINQVLLASYGAYLKAFAGDPSAVYVQAALGLGGLGILFGASYAGKVSRGFIESGLIPAAAIGMTTILLTLSLFTNHTLILCLFFVYGIFGGMLVVPLNSLIQYHADNNKLGKTMAANNFVQTVFMLSFLVINMLYASLNGNIRYFLFGLVLVAIGATVYAIIKFPQALIRFVLSFIASKFFRLRVDGLDNLPLTGGVLLLGNHTSFIDWAIIQISSSRPVRFVMERAIYEAWYLHWILKRMGVIPISSGASKEALSTIHHALKGGDVVALFPEGRLCQNGQLGHFHSGFERAAQDSGAQLVPFYLSGLWGTSSSYATKFYKELTKIRQRKISMSYGSALPDNTDAKAIKQAVTQLSTIAWKKNIAAHGTIASAWLQRVKQMPSSISIIDGMGIELNQAQLFSTVLYMRKRLQPQLLGQQNIGILLPAGAAGIIANLTCFLMGKTVVNLNYTAGEKSLLAATRQANLKTIITAHPFVDKLHTRGYDLSSLLNEAKPIYIETLKTPTSKVSIVKNLLFTRILPFWLLKLLLLRKQSNQDTAAILFSSGSEADPKGIELSHRNIIGNAKQISSVFNIEKHDRMLSTLPLFHAFGLTATTIMPLLEGTPVVCYPDPTDVGKISRLIHKKKVTVMCATSTFLGMYCRNKKVLPQMLSTLRLVIAGAEKLNQQTHDDFKNKFNVDIYEGYGTTEVAPVASSNLPNALNAKDWHEQITNKPGTVGLPLPGTAFKIVDPDTLDALPSNTEGMILIGGTQVMKGYLNNPEKTQQVLIPDGDVTWYITGDKGKLDEDGFLTIVDRYSRFAKIGGEMVSLSSVEQHVAMAVNNSDIDVMALAKADVKKGEKIVMLHTGEIDTQIVRQAMQAAGCNNLMIPTAFVQVEALPKLGSGKKDYKAGQLMLGEI